MAVADATAIVLFMAVILNAGVCGAPPTFGIIDRDTASRLFGVTSFGRRSKPLSYVGAFVVLADLRYACFSLESLRRSFIMGNIRKPTTILPTPWRTSMGAPAAIHARVSLGLKPNNNACAGA